MKTKIVGMIVAGIVAVASLCIAGSVGSSPKPTGDWATLREELHQTQAQLEQVVTRTSALEDRTIQLQEQVRALQASNTALQQAIEQMGKPKLVPIR